MGKFKQFLTESNNYNLLLEKLITFEKGGKFGQIVFLAGGAGSGKGFAVSNFLDSNKFKIRDIDEYKRLLLKVNKLKGKFPELKGMNLKNPDDVFKLHNFVKDKGIKEKTLDSLLKDLSQDRLPNIIFDITFKKLGDLTKTLPQLIEMGYNPKNIHLVWVLTDFYTAIKNNQGRSRVVPTDILLATHKGAKNSMIKIIKGQLPNNLDGAVHVILNNRSETVFHIHPKTGEPLDGKIDKNTGKKIRPLVIKSFTSLKVKDEGKPIKSESEVMKQVFDWIDKNTPKDSLTVKDITS